MASLGGLITHIGLATNARNIAESHPHASTACATTPLAPGDRDRQLAAEAAYYGRDWYGSFVDTSALYTSGCSQTMHTQPGPDGTPEVIAQKYAHCYDAACAPPSVAAFSCAEV